jgi:hypothetical protein
LEKDIEPFIRIRAESSACVQHDFISKLVNSFFVSEAKDIPSPPLALFHRH